MDYLKVVKSRLIWSHWNRYFGLEITKEPF